MGETRTISLWLVPGVLALAAVQGCCRTMDAGVAESASSCGEVNVIEEDGIYNPWGVHLAPLNLVTRSPLPPSSAVVESEPIPAGNFCVDAGALPDSTSLREVPGTGKISPVLQRWIDEEDGTEVREIILRFEDDQPVARLPPAGANGDRSKREDAIQSLIRARSAAQLPYLRELKAQFDFEPTGSFWLINAVSGNVRLDQVKVIADAPFVAYLQPVRGGELPPADVDPDNDAEDGRAFIQSDPYFGLGLSEPSIGLVDTGVRPSHQSFSPAGHLGSLGDCVHGGPDCNDSAQPQYDPAETYRHGTSAAGILMGSDGLGTEFRGVTAIRTDSWKVYAGPYGNQLDSAAVVRALQAGVRSSNHVLVAEVQAQESDAGSVAVAADSAYDMGAIIVAANGNAGPGAGTVRSPAIAHKVLGVGGFHIGNNQMVLGQGEGPAPDGRYKPDIQAPSHTETAHGQSDSSLAVFPDTSGATPYAGGAAMLVRNWLSQYGVVENGQVYALMILYGKEALTADEQFHNRVGAGPFQMATNGRTWWGKVVVGHAMTVDVPIAIDPNEVDLDVALWWPESEAQAHSAINLHALDPAGSDRASSQGALSVFQRASVPGPVETGTWTVRIRGNDVPTGQQLVYWAAAVKNG